MLSQYACQWRRKDSNKINICCVLAMAAGLQGPGGTGFGGGLFFAGSCTTSCFVDSNEFTDNTVPDGDGGGVYANTPTKLTLSNNLIANNFAGMGISMLVCNLHLCRAANSRLTAVGTLSCSQHWGRRSCHGCRNIIQWREYALEHTHH